jgi:anti-sigma regulatory factor (Ser/Thr protein kinase)
MASLPIMAREPGREGQADVRSGDVLVPHDPTSAGLARRAVAEVLASAHWRRDAIADAELLVSELVGNAVRHARPLPTGRLRIEWEVGSGRALIRVIDGGSRGSGLPHRLMTSVDSVSGRGLGIVAALAQEWGVDAHAVGQSVWAVITPG